MAIYMVTTWVPFDKAEALGEAAAKITKLPPYLKKWQILQTADGRRGGKSYNIIYVEDDKIAEAQLYISKLFSSYYGIKGFCYKAEPVMSQRDVAKLMQMEL